MSKRAPCRMDNITFDIHSKYRESASLKNFVENISQRFENEGEVIFSGSRNVIKTFCIDPDNDVLRHVVVKKFRARNIFQQLAYSSFWASKAKRAYHNGLRLTEMDANSTPYPIAFAETRRCGLLTQCYYVTVFTEAPSVREQLEKKPFNVSLATSFARFIAKLHDNGIVHHDLNFSNVLYSEEDGEYRISVIDINRMTTDAALSIEDCKDDFVRWTDDMKLYEHVMREYARARHLDEERFIKHAFALKRQHDKAWKRRKTFTHRLKKLF